MRTADHYPERTERTTTPLQMYDLMYGLFGNDHFDFVERRTGRKSPERWRPVYPAGRFAARWGARRTAKQSAGFI